MKGDILYVIREPLGFKSFECRRTPHSTKFDQLISRVVRYKHYGIEVEDEQVIHFVTESIFRMNEAVVKKTDMSGFVKDGIKCVEYSALNRYSRDTIVKRAYSQLDTRFDGYHVYGNNCEHFANWCASGFSLSRQVKLASYPVRAKNTIAKYPRMAKNKIVELLAVN